jgi:hypothetical protein
MLIGGSIPGRAQLSDGGKPLDISYSLSLKSKSVVSLPAVNNDLLLKNSIAKSNENRLKPFRFAEPLAVNLTSQNSGQWFVLDDYKVWQLIITSSGAKSLNLIFDHYKLPEDGRLFLFSADRRDLIGAFTAKNNKPSGTFATSPVVGDQLVVQYEEPLDAAFSAELSISQVNHDFVGVKSLKSDRRPLGVSGSCNINVNCDLVEAYENESNAACRIIVSGVDLCTGALVNNTNNDGTPYVYTAGHCIDSNKKASESIFLFNYESPYCGDIDGDASHSLSGSILRAESDKLDFSLVELGTIPPANYRPYFLGWERGDTPPDSTVCIHHPLGDVKKMAVDRHSPQIKTYSSDYIDNAHWFIGNWEEGTTEGGSSGAPLINDERRLVGSLTGGAATCEAPNRDYFARLGVAWDYYSQDSQQLKKWLDPSNSNSSSIDGLNPYSTNETCGAFTNFRDEDTHGNIAIVEQGVSKGYWSGNNRYGFQEFAEKYTLTNRSEISGVSVGVGKASLGNLSSDGKIRVSIYEGTDYPTDLIYDQDFSLDAIDEGVMNYLEFNQRVVTEGNFFVAYSLDLLQQEDTFAVYLAEREVDPLNSFYIKDGADWYTYQEKTNSSEGSALLMEVVLCNIDAARGKDTLKNANLEFAVFPNPFHSDQKLMVKFKQEVNPFIVQVFDLTGRQVNVQYEKPGDKWLSFDFSGQAPGNYFLKIVERKKRYSAKVVFLGDY